MYMCIGKMNFFLPLKVQIDQVKTHTHTHIHIRIHTLSHTHTHTHTHAQEGGEEGKEEGDEEGEKRVTVIETSTGEKLTGEDAPKGSELEQWLQEHPG